MSSYGWQSARAKTACVLTAADGAKVEAKLSPDGSLLYVGVRRGGQHAVLMFQADGSFKGHYYEGDPSARHLSRTLARSLDGEGDALAADVAAEGR